MTKNLNIRVEDSKFEKLDALAKMFDRDRSYLVNEALDNYLAMQEWQLESIRKGIGEADRGEFLSEKEQKSFYKEMEQ